MKTNRSISIRKLMLFLSLSVLGFARFIDSTDQDNLCNGMNGDGAGASLWGELYASTPSEHAYWNGRSEACYTSATCCTGFSDSLDLASSLWDSMTTCYYLGVIENDPVQKAYYFGLADGFDQEASTAAGY